VRTAVAGGNAEIEAVEGTAVFVGIDGAGIRMIGIAAVAVLGAGDGAFVAALVDGAAAARFATTSALVLAAGGALLVVPVMIEGGDVATGAAIA
jgi:hypothetical protein